MTAKKRLPIGIENFQELRTADFYYVDKTGFLKTLLENWGKVKLFTRPRRFGKTLNMSMLKNFFEYGCDRALFDGLEISEEKKLCEQYMGQYPVIFISLKEVEGDGFEEAKSMLRRVVGKESQRFPFLMQSDRLTEVERQQYKALVNVNEAGAFTMADELLKDSLLTLSQLLQKYFGQKVVVLIDEYDVPLEKAYQAGYYEAMTSLIRTFFGSVLKTNDSLQFAVLTGCLRVSKESIFTGLNNFNVYTVQDIRYHECFGFTDIEVREMLAYYGLMEQYDAVREWYDGYQFGNQGIYCPWDVINYCGALQDGSVTEPQNYWVNTSSNDTVRRFISRANTTGRKEIEDLIAGGSVKKKIRQELTYRDLDADFDNLWSVLFTTGYLTRRGLLNDGLTELVIPNREVRWIYEEQIREWFQEEIRKDTGRLENFCRAFAQNDVSAIEEGFNAYLRKTISIRDTSVRKEMKENFYHGILLGLFGCMDEWVVMSNAESGEGYSDIAIEWEEEGIGIVIELKYAEDAAFEKGCQEAMRQILDNHYEEVLIQDGMKSIYRYGIACYKKRCKVVTG